MSEVVGNLDLKKMAVVSGSAAVSNQPKIREQTDQVIIPGQVLFMASAWQQIEFFCRQSGQKETGGILVGRRVDVGNNPFIVVVFAGGPRNAAQRKLDEFEPDTAAMQVDLEQVRSRWIAEAVRVDYIGLWHRHPGHFKYLSNGDVKQAHNILTDPSYFLECGELVLPIALVNNKNVEFYPYYISRLHPEPLLLEWGVWEDELLHDLLLGK